MHPSSRPSRTSAPVWPQAALMAGIVIASYLVGRRADLFEAFAAWSRTHESLQLDELAVTLSGLSVAFTAVSLNRWSRMRKQTLELAQTSASLAQVRDRMQHVLTSSPVVIFVLRPVDGQLAPVWISDNLRALFGYRPDEVVSAEWWLERVHPDDRVPAGVAGRAAARGLPGRHEFRFRTAEGDYRSVLEELRIAGSPQEECWEVVGSWTDITARKAAEDELLRSRQDYLRLFLHANDAILLLDPADETVVDANPRAAALYGYPLQKLIGRSLRDLSVDPAAGDAHLRATLDGTEPYRFETVQRHADGSGLFVEVTASLTEYRDRQVVLSINRDVTERKRAEQGRAEIEARYRMLADGTDDVVSLHDAEGRFLYVSPSVLRATRYSPDELVGEPAVSVMNDADRERVLRANHQAAVHGRAEVEWRLAGRDGASPWFSSRIAVLRDAEGKVHRIVCSSRDVTERRQAHHALRFQAGLLEVVGQAVVAVDMNGSVLFWNSFAERLYGWTAAEALGRTPWTVAPSTSPKAGNVHTWAIVMDGGTWSGEMEMLRRDGTTFPAHVILSPIRDAEGAVIGAVGASSDLTAHKQLEQQLRQAQKMEAVGRLAGGVAHDFNNMLTAIRGNAQLLLGEIPAGTLMHEDVQEIDHAAARAADLTRQLLAFSRSQVLQPRLLNLNAVVRGVEPMLRRLIGEDIHFTTALADGLCTVRADPAQVEQIILNLVVNARDAMPHGGGLRIETRNLEPGEALGMELAEGADGCGPVALVVRDTGCGMDPETLERVFEPFFSTKAPGVGTGLGLSTVYGIVKQSGGHVAVESEPQRGSTFTICLPGVDALPDTPVAAAPAHDVPRGCETLLLVEDDEAVSAAVYKVLSHSGYHVLRAHRPSEALEMFAAHADEVRMVISDVVMPEMSGRDLAERLQAIRPGVPVLFTSGYMESAAMHPGIFSPNANFLPKPFTREGLTVRVRQVLDATAARAAA
jgi:two-component system cell cycle sensor histidine kinase/response regulator CckA